MHIPSAHAVPAARLIESESALREVSRRWLQAPALAVDTEFVRTRTFFPRLGLVQVADNEQAALVDAVAVPELGPLTAVLERAEVTKVLHSGAEDLEVLLLVLDGCPQPLFDTQIAAALAGYGYSISYQRLIKELFGLDLPKAETRSNWMRRPLSPAQIEYAILDVAYLLPAHELLETELRQQGRRDWAEEEFARLVRTASSRLDLDYSFRRLRRNNRLGRREVALLRELCAWREEEARRRDLPRSFVASDAALLQLVRKRPARLDRLAAIKDLKPRERARSGRRLVDIVTEVLARPEAELPPRKLTDRPSAGRNRGRVEALRAVVHEVAESLGLPAELLAQRRLLEELVRNLRDGAADPLPEPLRGWRREVVGERLLAEARRVGGE